MCSISGSFSKEKLIELCKANEYRGSLSHSVALFDEDMEFFSVHRHKGPVDYNFWIPPNYYCIVHQQAPTDEGSDIHPAAIGASLLWHNGLLKTKTIEALQKQYKTTVSWDTMLLLMFLQDHLVPNGVDGSFSCVFYDRNRTYLFRNELAPMFYDLNGNISSTKFSNSKSLEPNKMFTFNPKNIESDLYHPIDFQTVENPWVI